MDNHPILLFDGVCNLCNGSVQWIIRRDRTGIFRFASLQSAEGQKVLTGHGMDSGHFDSVVLIDGGRVFTHSDAALRVLRELGFPWAIGSVFIFLPKWLRDPVYNWIARNRYRWFGRKEQCMLPRPEWKNRFL